jgi:[protein-PII] uridylyltransferase
MPAELVEQLLSGASPTWVMGTPAAVLAADLALCHPALADGEVRARVTEGSAETRWQLGVVVRDRPGLLATTAGVLASHELTILSASCSSWPDLELASQRVVVASTRGATPIWDDIGEDLRRTLGQAEPVPGRFVPTPPVTVQTSADIGDRSVVTITAPDSVGLLWAVATWFADNKCNIELALIETTGAVARDTFVVAGNPDAMALRRALEGADASASTSV